MKSRDENKAFSRNVKRKKTLRMLGKLFPVIFTWDSHGVHVDIITQFFSARQHGIEPPRHVKYELVHKAREASLCWSRVSV